MAFAERLGNFIWNPWLLGLFLLSGLYFSVRTGFFQLFHVRLWLKTTLGSLLRPKRRREGGGLTQLQALSTALASTIGTGSIAGVATAIFYGGPGAVFWMWVSAFLGMMTGCVEKTLAVRYREKSRDGGWQGGPMCYMERGVGSRTLAALFSLCCVAASLGGGNVVQANSIAASLEAAFGWDRLAVGLVVAVLTGLVILGGIGRIGRVSETLVPCMAILFIGGGVVVLICHRAAIPEALERIVTGAITPKAALGGGIGYGMAAAMRYGVARGVFTNEAGMGSSAIAHAASNVQEPAEQGMWGIFEVFIATLSVCSITALVILTSGVYQEDAALGSRTLAALFSLCCVAASLGGGNVVQANSIAASLEAAFGWDRLAVGLVVAVLTGLVILGGIGRIGRVSETLVPCMAILFIGGGVVVLICHRAAIPEALERIVTGAITPKAALGGGIGYGMAAAMRYGVARGVFTNEAGMGSSAIAHAASNVQEPAEQGMWGIFEVFIATLSVCSITALVILTSGVYQEDAALLAIQSGTVTSAMVGAPLSAAAFSTVFGRFGVVFVAVCLLLFAFTSLLGSSYYGERGLQYLTGTDRWRWPYRAAFLLAVVAGSVGDVAVVWQLADIFNGLMALPNLCALLLLSPEALGLLNGWMAVRTDGAAHRGRSRRAGR